jgi:beta-glucosidase
MINRCSKILATLLTCSSALLMSQELQWDWASIDTNAVHFDKNFIFGTAVSEYQVSGASNCPDAQWAAWDYTKDSKGNPRIHQGQRSGKACDFWHTYEADIELLKQMKVKSFRFSLEWSVIEPQKGIIDTAAIKHYHDLMDKLIAADIKPVVSLHHFTHPIWFEELNAFEKEENIHYFVDFAQRMVNEYNDKVMLWATFNEPGVYVFQGYIRGVWPPGKVGVNRAGQVTQNMLKAHVAAYQAIKKIAPKSQVGMVHSITQFEPFNDGTKIEATICNYMNHLFHDAITEFFATGKFCWQVPILSSLEYTDAQATKSLDFFGINYYSHVLLNVGWMSGDQAFRLHEIKTDMPYCIYAEGLYRAIKDVSERIAVAQNIPIYITENGIADAKDDRRELFIKRYLYALYRAVQDGYDVRGYFYWSLLDNFEWDHGYSQKFGLYEVDMLTGERRLRDGARAFLNIIDKTYHKDMQPNAPEAHA